MVPREKHPKEGEKMNKLLVLVAMVAIIALPATGVAEEDESEIMTTFSYGLSGGNLGTAHTVGIGFQFPPDEGGIASKIELQYLSYIDSRGNLNLYGWTSHNEFTATLTPSYQGILTLGIGSQMGSSRNYGYFSIEGIFGTAKGKSVRTYEEHDWETPELNDWIVRQEIKSDDVAYAGLGVGPDIEIYPTKHIGFSVGGRVGFLRASTAFGEDSNNQKYFRGFAVLKVRL